MSLFNILDYQPNQEDAAQVIKELSNTCNSCHLALIHPMNKGLIYRGDINAKIAILGEAPGDTETERGIPFIGRSGQEFERWMKYLKINTKKDLFIINTVNCFTGDALVQANGIQRIYRRFYTGPAIRITTKNGTFTGTPNHPTLTQRGWIPLGELNKSDYLINGEIVRNKSTIRPNINDRPTTFKEMFSTLEVSGIKNRIVCGSDDFHGDFSDSYIDIISVDSSLGSNNTTSFLESFRNPSFIPPDHRLSNLSITSPSFSTFHNSTNRLFRTFESNISQFCKALPIFLTCTFIPRFITLINRTNFNSHFKEFSLDSFVKNTSLRGDTSKTFPRQISLTEILKIEVIEISEHVYNLSTNSEQYIVNNIITHNCQPNKELKEGRLQQKPPSQDEITACFGPRTLRVLKALTNLEVIITLGWVGAKAILGGDPGIKTHNGQWFESSLLPGKAIFCMVHPAYILRQLDNDPEARRPVERMLDYFNNEYLQNNKDIVNLAKEIEENRNKVQ